MPRDETWSVTVERNGEKVVTIASNSLGGRDLSEADERVIRLCGEHLLAFVGSSRSADFLTICAPVQRTSDFAACADEKLIPSRPTEKSTGAQVDGDLTS